LKNNKIKSPNGTDFHVRRTNKVIFSLSLKRGDVVSLTFDSYSRKSNPSLSFSFSFSFPFSFEFIFFKSLDGMEFHVRRTNDVKFSLSLKRSDVVSLTFDSYSRKSNLISFSRSFLILLFFKSPDGTEFHVRRSNNVNFGLSLKRGDVVSLTFDSYSRKSNLISFSRSFLILFFQIRFVAQTR
jgi:hypothetical protein